MSLMANSQDEPNTAARGTNFEGSTTIRTRGSPKASANEAVPFRLGVNPPEISLSAPTTPTRLSPESGQSLENRQATSNHLFYQGQIPGDGPSQSIKGACLLIQSLRCDPCFSLHLCPYGCFVGTALGRVVGYLFEPIEGPTYYVEKCLPQVVPTTQHSEFATAQSNPDTEGADADSRGPMGTYTSDVPTTNGPPLDVGTSRHEDADQASKNGLQKSTLVNQEYFFKKRTIRSRLIGRGGQCGPTFHAYPKTPPRGRLQLYSGHAIEAAKAVYADATSVYAVIGSSLLQKWERLSPCSPIRLEMETAQQRWPRSSTKFVLQWKNTAVILHPGSDGWQQRVNMTDCVALRAEGLKGDYVPCDFSNGKLLVTIRQKHSPAVAMIFFLPDPDSVQPYELWKHQFSSSTKLLSHFKFWEPDRIVYTKGARTVVVHNYRTDHHQQLKGHLDDVVAISAESQRRVITMGRDAHMKVWTDEPEATCLVTIDCSPATFFSGYTHILAAYGPLVAFSADQGIFFTNLLAYVRDDLSDAVKGWERTDLDHAFAATIDSDFRV
eukprot:Selendium_serpulae@DN3036_c0_g1_i1.p1